MTHPDDATTPQTCSYGWCTTAHGHTIHPDDEDHRSEGTPVGAVVRTIDGGTRETELEFGLLRRRDDAQTWFVLEDGVGVHLELTLDSARDLLRAVRADASLSAC